MSTAVPFAKRVQPAALHLLTIILLSGVLVLPTGCSWFRKGTDTVVENPDSIPTAPTASTTDDGLTVPTSAEPDGPRPGDLLPFPELQVIYFDYDRATLRADQLARIENNLRYLLDHPEERVMITGHCDERGTTEYNYVLGMRRAEAVRDYYVKNGVVADRIAVQSKGEDQPVALGHDEAAWSQNRRAEFHRMY